MAVDYPLTLRHRDGTLTEVLYNASVYRDTGGKVLGVFAAARDAWRLEWSTGSHTWRGPQDLIGARAVAKLGQATSRLQRCSGADFRPLRC